MTPHFDKVYRGCQQGQAAHVAVFAQCPKNIADKQGETLVMARTTLEEGEHEEYETITGVGIKDQGDAFAEAIEKTVSDPLTEGSMRSFMTDSSKMDGHHAGLAFLDAVYYLRCPEPVPHAEHDCTVWLWCQGDSEDQGD